MSSKPKQPMAVQLAKASWAAPLIFILMNVFLNNVREADPKGVSNVVVAAVGVLLFLVGAICGLAALSGVRHHGRKGILVPALVGLSLSAAMLTFTASVFFATLAEVTDPRAQIESAAASMREDLPRMVDEETELVDVSVETSAIVYSYRLVNYRSGELDLAAFDEAMQPELEGRLCGPMREVFEAGFSAVSEYRTEDDAPFAELVVRGEDCGIS